MTKTKIKSLLIKRTQDPELKVRLHLTSGYTIALNNHERSHIKFNKESFTLPHQGTGGEFSAYSVLDYASVVYVYFWALEHQAPSDK